MLAGLNCYFDAVKGCWLVGLLLVYTGVEALVWFVWSGGWAELLSDTVFSHKRPH